MQRAVTVRGRLTSPTEVVLDEPIGDAGGEAVEVTVRLLPAGGGRRLVDIMRALSPAGASKAELDRRLRGERDAWD